jgi:ankyrin repeat protein
LIDSKGIAINNYHVLEGASNAVAISSTGEKYNIEKIIDYSIKNRYLNTPLHLALYINIDDFFIYKSNLNIMIKNTDLSIQNLYNEPVYDLLKKLSDKHKIKFNNLFPK